MLIGRRVLRHDKVRAIGRIAAEADVNEAHHPGIGMCEALDAAALGHDRVCCPMRGEIRAFNKQSLHQTRLLNGIANHVGPEPRGDIGGIPLPIGQQIAIELRTVDEPQNVAPFWRQSSIVAEKHRRRAVPSEYVPFAVLDVGWPGMIRDNGVEGGELQVLSRLV